MKVFKLNLNPNVLALLFGLFLCFIILVFIEIIFGTINTIKNCDYREARIHSRSYVQDNDLLGNAPYPNISCSVIKANNSSLVFKAKYSIDSFRRRKTPVANLDTRKKYALFFGGSFTFGEGVNDNETLPYYFAKYAMDYKPYNYAFPGYGTQHLLAKLESNKIRDEIKESNGLLIYIFNDWHVLRVIGNAKLVATHGERYPYYTYDASGNLIRKKDFNQGRFILTKIYKLLAMSGFVNYFNIDFPLVITDKHIKLTADVIIEARNNFRTKFNSDNFYVVIYPGAKRFSKKMISYLKEANVKYLDLSDLLDKPLLEEKLNRDLFYIKGDGHPTAKLHELVGKKLAEVYSYHI